MEVEDEVELADVAEIPIQALHEVVDGLQAEQLVVLRVDAWCKNWRKSYFVYMLEEHDKPLTTVAVLKL